MFSVQPNEKEVDNLLNQHHTFNDPAMLMSPNKSCPVVIRECNSQVHVLAFRHPAAGCQVVKGTIEPGERPGDAALRELFEEAGISSAKLITDLGEWDSQLQGQIWSFHLCEVSGLPDTWVHHTEDGGGHDFVFFWQPLHEPLGDEWHPLYKGALKWIGTVLTRML